MLKKREGGREGRSVDKAENGCRRGARGPEKGVIRTMAWGLEERERAAAGLREKGEREWIIRKGERAEAEDILSG